MVTELRGRRRQKPTADKPHKLSNSPYSNDIKVVALTIFISSYLFFKSPLLYNI